MGPNSFLKSFLPGLQFEVSAGASQDFQGLAGGRYTTRWLAGVRVHRGRNVYRL